MKLVSACLCGVNCKYNGGNNLHPYFVELLVMGEVIPVCPEQLGGLTTPRSACEISGGTGLDVIEGVALVINRNGMNVTKNFVRGAEEALSIAIRADVDGAILKRGSPSCGTGTIHDGTFTHKMIAGDGVTTAMLKQHGFQVWNEEDYLREKGVCTSIESS
ncbi:MAG TPA: DUF523 domain-containing protein [Syntrophomonadaceae bacterium]|jgi:uncharacterized protein YbbK (DUF523 family)|nr:DUF523 domain-containing protein [Syntrophomonadaceae bacterium]